MPKAVPLSQTLTEFIFPGTFLLAPGLRPCMRVHTHTRACAHTHTMPWLTSFWFVACMCVMYSKCPGNIDTRSKTHERRAAAARTGSEPQPGLGNDRDAPQLRGPPPAVFIQRLLTLYLGLLPRKHLHFVNSGKS